MNKVKAIFTPTSVIRAKQLPTGQLLLNDADEIVYANTQARHFLGLLSDESLPSGQKFLPLLRQTYQFYPTIAWLGWPKRPSATSTRYLIYMPPNGTACSLLQVEILEKILLDGKNIWVISIHLVDSQMATAVTCPTV
jgi:hypothetical protein